MKNCRHSAKAVCLKRNVFVFGGINSSNNNLITSVEKYSLSDGSWSNVSHLYGRSNYCICSFMDKIYLFGGCSNRSLVDSTLQFDPNRTNNDSWKEVAGMIKAREDAACAVFEERIIVSGGYNGGYNRRLKSVESYDVIGNEWSSMPNMTKCRGLHNLVVVKDKLFVIGYSTDNCEIYDSIGKRFVALRSNSLPYNKEYDRLENVINVGNKILAFNEASNYAYAFSDVLCYDVERNKWSVKSDECKSLIRYSVVSIPSC